LLLLTWPSRQHIKLQVLGDLDMPFEDIKGPLSNWVKTESIQRQIKLRFRAFLDQYRDENNNLVYKQRIRDMCIGRSEICLACCCSHLCHWLCCCTLLLSFMQPCLPV